MGRQEDAYAFRFEGREYRIGKLMISEARAIQKITGYTMGQVDARLKLGDVDCLAAILWVARKREEPTLKYSAVEGDVGSFEPLDDERGRAVRVYADDLGEAMERLGWAEDPAELMAALLEGPPDDEEGDDAEAEAQARAEGNGHLEPARAASR